MAEGARRASATAVGTASAAATKSPYAEEAAKSCGTEAETTPGTSRLSPPKRNAWGTTRAASAAWRSAVRSLGEMKSFVTRPKATKLMRTLTAQSGWMFTRHLLVECAGTARVGQRSARPAAGFEDGG